MPVSSSREPESQRFQCGETINSPTLRIVGRQFANAFKKEALVTISLRRTLMKVVVEIDFLQIRRCKRSDYDFQAAEIVLNRSQFSLNISVTTSRLKPWPAASWS